MNKPLFSLVDCNNFYASVERLWRPDLKSLPIVVASNNDASVVARSPEAKALGIKMGQPVFEIRDLIRRHGVKVFSSNYALYASVSAQVMECLEELAPRISVYSIDEAFLDLTGCDTAVDLTAYGRQVRETVGQWTGITVCVGIAPTHTLAKLANHGAKRYPATGGVVDLTDPARQRKLMSLLPVDEVWGIGRRLARRLEPLGITTALQLADANTTLIRKKFSLVVERTVRELNGESCIDLEVDAPTKQQIVTSRSFGERITTLQHMREAISEYVSRAAEKLRGEAQCAGVITVFIRTGGFNSSEAQYANSATARLPRPTDDSRDLLEVAMKLLREIWRDGYRYAKGGVMLSDFRDPGVYQPSLFDEPGSSRAGDGLMQVLDSINARGRGQLWFASQGSTKAWAMKRTHLSPAYTTRWSDLPKVR